MQSQYGVPEIQQFMADGGCSPVFSIATADMQGSSQAQKQQQHHHHHHHGHHLQHQQQSQRALHHHQHLHLHHHHLPQVQLQQPVALPPPQAFQHFQPIPVTQQLFQHGPQFQLFQQEQQRRIHQQLVHLGLEIESGPENSSSPTRNIIPSAAAGGGGGGGIPPFLGGAGFKLTINESGGGGGGDSRDRLNDDEGILQGDEESETHIHLWNAAREEEPGIKEPFWRPLDVDYINRNNKRCKDQKQPEPSDSGGKHCKSSREGDNVVDDGNNSASNYKLFSELEAIYKPVGSGGGGGDGSGGGGSGSRAGLNNNQQTGSGSALTGENPPTMAAEPRDADWGRNGEDADRGSDDTSTGEEAAQIEKPNKSGGGGGGRRKRKRKQQLSSIASFFESLVKRLMEHQEGLHRKFLEILDRRDQERMNREELWRQQEASKTSREATARAQEQALASTREAAIISFLEKITGESLNLPTREQFQSRLPAEESSQKEGPMRGDLQPDSYAVVPVDGSDADVNHNAGNADPGTVNPSRWPKAEVQALIRVRSSLESRFQEPGLKGPLWEEVSAAMAGMGYQRSAKRCKEKWENINKYFRKTKDSPKKRSQQSKTCPYFHQLDQLYSKSLSKAAATPQAGAAAAPSTAVARRDSSELLDAVVVHNDKAPSCFGFPDVDAARMECGSRGDDDNHEASGSATAGRRVGEADDDDDDDEEEEEEGEGDSQEQAARSSRGHDDRPDHQHDRTPRDAAVFFRRLET